jgi:flagellar basal body P-ring protein FlgI
MQDTRDNSAPRNSESILWRCVAVAALLAAAAMAQSQIASQLARVKDVATIEGIRDNQLVGYGLVVGLRGNWAGT